jgi:hypothetical protein
MSEEAEPERPAGAGAASAFASLFAVLFAPDRGMERHARVGKARWFFLFAWVCSLLLGAALAYRVDARSSTLQKMEESGQLQGTSDRQIAEETTSAERVFQVSSLAKGATRVPVQLGLACVAILFLCWFFRGRVKGSAVVPVAAATLVPGGIANLVDAITALRRTMLPPEAVPLAPRTLSDVLGLVGHPLMPPVIKLGNALDFYSLWAALMLAFGVAAVGQVPRRTAAIGTLIAWICYRLLTNVATGG